MPYSDERNREIAAMVADKGTDATAEIMGITRETVRRAARRARVAEGTPGESCDKLPAVLRRLAAKFSEAELRAMANSSMPQGAYYRPVHDFTGRTVTVGFMTDLHLGSKKARPEWIAEAFGVFRSEGADMVVVAGDVTEGMNPRAGHVYELSHIGYRDQRDHAVEVLGAWDCAPMYLIDGNHDRWYTKSNGARIVPDICDRIPNAEYVGSDVGPVWLSPNVELRLWHGEDGNSYATSYRPQKVIESITGGDKPSVLLLGHTHKQGYFFDRHIHCVSGGCMQQQTDWMRGKRYAAHTGFWILRVTVNDKGVGAFESKWHPFYA